MTRIKSYNMNEYIKQDFQEIYDNTAVPYLNKDADYIQDLLAEVESNTSNLQVDFIPQNGENIIDVSFHNKN